MADNSPKTYSVMVIILLLACAVAGYFIMTKFYPAYNTAKDSYAVAVATNEKTKQALNSIQTFLSSFKQQGPNVNKVKLALPAGDPDMPNFISSLSQVAQASGIALSDFQINGGVQDEENVVLHMIQTQDLGMSASGSFESFKDFMNRIESHLRLVDISHVSVAAGAAGNAGAPILNFQIKMRTYYQQ